MKPFFTLLFLAVISCSSLNGQIVITEIFYNSTGWDDTEFIEFYNTSGQDINMKDYYIGDGFVFTFPDIVFPAGSYLLLTEDSLTLQEEFGVAGYQWEAGSTSNSGEDISIYSADSMLIDYVDYEDDTNGWPIPADGLGYSLSLCDINADNEDPANWQLTTGVTGLTTGRRKTWISPNMPSTCATGPIVTPYTSQYRLIEGITEDTVFISFHISNANGSPSSISLSVDPSSTVSPDEYSIPFNTIEFDGNGDSTITVFVVSGVNDNVAEGIETLQLNIDIVDNVGVSPYENVQVTFYDDDNTLNKGLLLVGVFSAAINEFGVELFALKDIPDLSIYGLGTANNGGGTDGVEIPLPAGSLSAGDRYFVSDSKVRFSNFFGIETDFNHPAIWVTGNDAIELFEHGVVIDTYGEIDVDGEGTTWDFDDGWAVRFEETEADSTIFNQDNWFAGNVGRLDGATNVLSSAPYPLNFYTNSTGTNELLPSSHITLYPNPTSDLVQLSLTTDTEIDLFDVSVFDITSNLLQFVKIPKGATQTTIDVFKLPVGMYLVSLATSEGIATKKLVKN